MATPTVTVPMGQCLVCGLAAVRLKYAYRLRTDATGYNCVHCGEFGLTRQAEVWLDGSPHEFSLRRRAILSHAIRRAQAAQDGPPLFGSDFIERVIAGALPTPQEQADNLVLWLGANLPGPGERMPVSFTEHGAIVGAQSEDGFQYIVDGLLEEGMITTPGGVVGGGSLITLKFLGWQRYEALRRGAPSGGHAFMAIQYGDAQLEALVKDHLTPAVAQTGFELRRLIDRPRAGSIDDRLRVESVRPAS